MSMARDFTPLRLLQGVAHRDDKGRGVIVAQRDCALEKRFSSILMCLRSGEFGDAVTLFGHSSFRDRE